MCVELTAKTKRFAAGARVSFFSSVDGDMGPQFPASFELRTAFYTTEFPLVLVNFPMHAKRRARLGSLAANVTDKLSAFRVRFHMVPKVAVPREGFVADRTGERSVFSVYGFAVAR